MNKKTLTTLLAVPIIVGSFGYSVPEQSTIPEQSVTSIVTEQSSEKVYIKKTYEELWAVFRPDSKFTDFQKQKTFNEEYKGKYVKWTGKVKNVEAIIPDDLRLYIKHGNKDQFEILGEGDMTIKINKDQYDKLVDLFKGDMVTYSAKFTSFGSFIFVNFRLEDGDIISKKS